MQREEEKAFDEENRDPIRVLEVSKVYPNGFKAIKDISFCVEKREIFGLLGPNGAGKSTTFNIITAKIPRTKGDVFLKGELVENGNMTVFKDVGVCP